MSTDALRHIMVEVMAHQPFACDSVYLYRIDGGTLVALDAESESLHQHFRPAMLKIVEQDSGMGSWYGALEKAPTGEIEGGWCYGASRVRDLLVVVRKPVHPGDYTQTSSLPIDSYFLWSMSLCLGGLLGISVEGETAPPAYPFVSEGIAAELASLDRFEYAWRSHYGEESWLAVSGGTVIAHGPSRQSVEEDVGVLQHAKPVLYVPPKSQSQSLDLYSLD